MKKLIPIAVLALAMCTSAKAFAALKVVTTTQDLESLTREVGGDKVSVESLE
jgi:ABC-type Zn uptake system ZnuABC Zn-binding protein ZnuA